ncbi:MAG: TetR family transcriptional regulator [Nakamurella sp.]
MSSARTPRDDLTARARIRDSAIVYFGRHGFQSATVRAIAADAGVSPALVIHHFGSKDGLRSACEDYLTFCIDDLAQHAASHLEAVDLLDLMARTPQLTPLVPYMIQTITEGGDFAAKLWERLVQDTETYLRAAVSAGKIRPTGDERARAEVLSTFKLGMYLLSRYTMPAPSGGRPGDLDIQAISDRFTVPTLELLTHGMFTTTEYLDLFVAKLAAEQGGVQRPDAAGAPGLPDSSPPGITPISQFTRG